MKRLVAGLAALALMAQLIGFASAGRRCGGGGGYAGCASYAAAGCGYTYQTSYQAVQRTVYISQPETTWKEETVTEMVPVTKWENREHVYYEQQPKQVKRERTILVCSYEQRQEKQTFMVPETVMENRTVYEYVPVMRQVAQEVIERIPEMKTVMQPREYWTMKPTTTQVNRQVVCYTPHTVHLPPSCCNPCGSVCTQMVPTVQNVPCTVTTYTPERHVENVAINVCSYREERKKINVNVPSVERKERQIQVPVCRMVSKTENVTVMVPVTKQQVVPYVETIWETVQKKEQVKVAVCSVEQQKRQVKVAYTTWKTVAQQVTEYVPVTTCVPVVYPGCGH